MVPSVPVTPAPAVAGPFNGGQICAQLPVQLDLLAVSGPNQYRVNPWALVSTVVPLTVAVFSADPDAPPGLPEPGDELPHAAAITAAAAIKPAARNLFRIRGLPSADERSSTWNHVSHDHPVQPRRRRSQPTTRAAAAILTLRPPVLTGCLSSPASGHPGSGCRPAPAR